MASSESCACGSNYWLGYRAHMPPHPHSDYLDGTDPDPVDFLLQVVVPSSPDGVYVLPVAALGP